MLRVVENNRAVSAKRYYTDGLSSGDYYVGDGESASFWGGKGAELLGLAGAVDRKSFNRLCENVLPDGSGKLTGRTKANRRVGYDFNFHCPKSVSVLWALTGDTALRAAFLEAVSETMLQIEAEAKTRVRLGGVSTDRPTGSLVWGTFVHTTTRPIGGLPDPHLHVHAFTFNATYDAAEGRWKAAQFGDINRNAPYFEACFHASFAAKVAALGYGVERRGRFWEIANVPDSVIDKFSRRTAEIERVAEAKGITDARAKDKLGRQTRKRKSESRPWAEVEADWRARLSPTEWQALKAAKGGGRQVKGASIREALEHGLQVAFERSSVADERRVIEHALRFGVGSVTPEAARRELGRLDVVRREGDGRAWLSAKRLLEDEGRMVSLAREGRAACQAMKRGDVELQAAGLSGKQRASVLGLLGSRDRVMLFQPEGDAGVAKAAARRAIEACGHSVVTLDGRGSGQKATGLEEALGKFTESGGAKSSRVLWVENAEGFGAGTLARLFQETKEHGGRVVLCGRVKERGPVELRGALATLTRLGGVLSERAERREERQREERAALKAIGDGRSRSALPRLEKLGDVREVPREEVPAAVAREFARAMRQKQSARIRTKGEWNGQWEKLSSAVRNVLRSRRLLGKSRDVEQLRRVGLSEEARRDPKNFERGQIVEFSKSVKGFKAGQRYVVMGKDPFGNVLARKLSYRRPFTIAREGTDTRRVRTEKLAWVEALPLSRSENFDVFRSGKLQIAKGDLIRTTGSGKTVNERFGIEKLMLKRGRAIRAENLKLRKKLFNIPIPDRRYRVRKDATYRVRGFTLRGNIKLDNGWVLPRNFAHLDYGYCETDGGKQSVQRLFVVAGEKGGEELGRERLPKGLKSVVVFTDDKERLLGEAAKSQGGESSRKHEQEKAKQHERARAAEQERATRQQRAAGREPGR